MLYRKFLTGVEVGNTKLHKKWMMNDGKHENAGLNICAGRICPYYDNSF